ncbi:hypothetical protein ROLI_032490 [Roseobacter fucihabitans]|uniref:Uncharacterized protein n=1 Tax=Roseobacter fucihabitans TaxID=1537242 RepID=A0ABZ2BXQ3_9RHOB|nr:hypothetical protein [Roseobacter litoralis]MBC6965055.1 hypothetical protein [Roseobacter litoralis]
MSLVYCCERSHLSIRVLCLDPGNLRQRLPLAWEAGHCAISENELPETALQGRKNIPSLRQFFTQKQSSIFGSARASVRRKHETTLIQVAQQMLQPDTIIRDAFDSQLQEETL